MTTDADCNLQLTSIEISGFSVRIVRGKKPILGFTNLVINFLEHAKCIT